MAKASTLTMMTTKMTYLKVSSRDDQNWVSLSTLKKLAAPTKFLTADTPFQSVRVR